MTRPRIYKPRERLRIHCPTAFSGIREGECEIIRIIDYQLGGATGIDQPIYLVRQGGVEWSVPHEALSELTVEPSK